MTHPVANLGAAFENHILENRRLPARDQIAPPSAPYVRELRASLKLALPLVGAQLAHVAIGTTDILMMGWLGPESLAAGALANNLMFPVYLFGLGIISSTAPFLAQALGARQLQDIRPVLQQGLWISLALAVLSAAFLWYGEAVLVQLGQAQTTAALSQSYLRVALWGLLPAFWIVVLRSFLSAHSRPRAVLLVTILGIGVNALGNYTLMFGHFGFPALGLVGAGIASTLVHAVMFLVLMIFILGDGQFRRYHLLTQLWQVPWRGLLDLLRIGLPIGFSILAETTLFAGAAMLMGLIGTTELAAHAIALQCLAVAFMVPLGISQAATVRVGLAVGAGDPAGVARSGWIALAMNGVFSALPILCFAVFPMTLAGFFLDLTVPATQPVLAMVVVLLGIAALFQAFDGAMVVAAGVLRGLKDTRIPMWVAIFSFWLVGFGSSVLFGFGLNFGALGVWAGLALGVFVSAVLLIVRFRILERRLAAPAL